MKLYFNKTINITFLLIIVILFSCENSESKIENVEKEIVPSYMEEIPDPLIDYQRKAMILGSFHFNRNNDGSDVVAINHTDISTSENQREIEQIVHRIVSEFRPTVVGIEWMPSVQPQIDSLYNEYRAGNWQLSKNEAFQIGFRVAEKMGLETVHCIDNRPPQPETVTSIDDWDVYAQSLDQEELWHEYDETNDAYNSYLDSIQNEISLTQYLALLNSEEVAKRNKELWLTGLVNLGYRDQYIGADLTGHWYRRNARIFVNARNLCTAKDDRILIIYGNAHRWVLEELFEGSPEFEVEPSISILK